jgi:hypothetical protein
MRAAAFRKSPLEPKVQTAARLALQRGESQGRRDIGTVAPPLHDRSVARLCPRPTPNEDRPVLRLLRRVDRRRHRPSSMENGLNQAAQPFFLPGLSTGLPVSRRVNPCRLRAVPPVGICPRHHECHFARGNGLQNVDARDDRRVVRGEHESVSSRARRDRSPFSVYDPQHEIGDRRLSIVPDLVVVPHAVGCPAASASNDDRLAATALGALIYLALFGSCFASLAPPLAPLRANERRDRNEDR